MYRSLVFILRNRDVIDTLSTHIHELSLLWLGIGTSIKGGGIKLYL